MLNKGEIDLNGFLFERRYLFLGGLSHDKGTQLTEIGIQAEK